MAFKEDAKFVLNLSRPRFWLYLGGTYLIGFAAGAESLSLFLSPTFILHLIFFLTFSNVFLYGINDLFDNDTDRFNKKKGSKEVRLARHSRTLALFAVGASFLLSLLVVLLQPDVVSRMAMLSFVFLSAAYSAPPFRFKATPFFDFSSNLLYALPGVVGFVHSSGALPPAGAIVAAFLWAWAMHLFSAVPDIAPDSKARVRTTAVFLGARPSLALCTVFWGGFAALAIQSGYFGALGLMLLVYPAMPLLLLLYPSLSIDRAYWLFPYINGAIGMLGFFFIISKNGLMPL